MQPDYKRRLHILFVVAVLGVGGLFASDIFFVTNFLGPGALDLHRNGISHLPPGVRPEVIFIGGSSVTPDISPTTNSPSVWMNKFLKKDVSYNLGTAGGNILTAMARCVQARAYRPKHAIIGLNPHDFDISLEYSRVVVERPELIQPYVPSDIMGLIIEKTGYQLRYALLAQSWRQSFEFFPTVLAVTSFDLASKVYDNFFDNRDEHPDPYFNVAKTSLFSLGLKDRKTDLLRALNDAVQGGGMTLTAYLTPLLPDRSEIKIFGDYVAEMKRILSQLNVKLLDYSTMSSDPLDFNDSDHLSELGNQKLAAKLWSDFSAVRGLKAEP